MKDDWFYVIHILECIGNVEEDTASGREHFVASRTIRDAVMRNLQILAESSSRISPELQSRHPEVEWRQLRNFRHVVVHDYTEIDYELIWRLVTTALPQLKAQLTAILAERPHS